MYDFFTGRLHALKDEFITLAVNGVGYKIFVPLSVLRKSPPLGKEMTLFVSFVVREQSQALFGFLQEAERDFFEALLNISGIGPKTALNIIGHVSFEELSTAIVRGDTRILCKVPGIGKKTAERLIVELKDKLRELSTIAPRSTAPQFSLSHDAQSALMNLGYNQMVAQRAVQNALTGDEITDLSTLIERALKVAHAN